MRGGNYDKEILNWKIRYGKHVITNYVLQGVVMRLSATRGFSPDLLTYVREIT